MIHKKNKASCVIFIHLLKKYRKEIYFLLHFYKTFIRFKIVLENPYMYDNLTLKKKVEKKKNILQTVKYDNFSIEMIEC